MKLTTLLLSTLAAHQVASLEITISGTRNGVPIPQSELKLTEFNRTTSSPLLPAGGSNKKLRRANPTETSSNWCGSAAKATTANRIKTITGVLQHPNCRGRAGVPFPQALAPWVGIDGARAQNSILQAGTTCAVDDTSGKVNNFVWMQWLPANSMMVNNFPVKAGDFVKVTIETSSTTSAKITMENLSQGYANVLRLSNSPTPISGIDAVWLIESPVLNGQIVKLPKYDELWIQEASATLMDGKKLGILGALQYQMTGQCKSQEYDDSTVSFTFP